MATDKNSERYSIYTLNKDRLAELAWRAIHVKKMNRNSFFAICIDYDDPAWTDVADYLMPNHDWKQYRDRGERPIARGTVPRDSAVVNYIKKVVPDVAPAFGLKFGNDDHALVVVLACGGALALVIKTKPQPN